MKHERQVLMDGWNQDAIQPVKAVVVGCGALGSQLALSLARLGVQDLLLIDPDTLDEHNLENQAYTHDEIGEAKAVALAKKVQRINPDARAMPLVARVEDARLKWDADVLFGCLDNVAARHILNHIAIQNGIPLIDGGIDGLQGVVKIVQPGQSACLACHAFYHVPRRASCSSDPIPSTYATANIVANLQALQFVRLVHGWDWRSHVAIDLRLGALHSNDPPRNPACSVCGSIQ